MGKKLIPFADESSTFSIGDLNAENRVDRVSLFGSVDLTMDKKGLAHALALKKIVDGVVAALQREKSLPDTVKTTAPKTVKNPFGG